MKDGAYVINIDDKRSTGTHWVSLFVDRNTAVYFDSFGIEYIPPEVLNQIRDLVRDQLLTIYLEYKMMILLCVHFIVFLSWKMCFQEKLCCAILIYFL